MVTWPLGGCKVGPSKTRGFSLQETDTYPNPGGSWENHRLKSAINLGGYVSSQEV